MFCIVIVPFLNGNRSFQHHRLKADYRNIILLFTSVLMIKEYFQQLLALLFNGRLMYHQNRLDVLPYLNNRLKNYRKVTILSPFTITQRRPNGFNTF